MRSRGNELLGVVAAGALGGMVFGLGLFALDTGGIASLAGNDRDGMVVVATMAAPLLALFGIAALAAGLPGEGRPPAAGFRSLRLARAAAARRRRRPPRG